MRSRRRLLVRLGIAAGASVFALYLGLWGALIGGGGSDGADFTAFYTGWTIVADGRGPELYDPTVQAEVQRALLGGRTFEAGLNPFNNPPHLVLPFVPFAELPLRSAYLLWSGVQVALLAWLLWRLVTQFGMHWRREERLLMIGASLAAPPLALALLQGSFSLLVAVAWLEVYLALRHGGIRRAVAGLVAASIKPQAILTTGIALLAGRRWTVVGWSAVSGLVLAAVATLALGIGIWSSYVHFLGDYIGSFDVFSVRPSVMWNLRGTLALMYGSNPSAAQVDVVNTIALGAQIAVLAGVAWLWRGSWDPERPAFAIRFSLTVVLGLLFSPHLNPHDDLLLVPAAVIAYDALRGEGFGRRLGLAMFASPFLVLVVNGLSVNEVGGPPIRLPVVLMLGFAAMLAWTLRRERTAGVGGYGPLTV